MILGRQPLSQPKAKAQGKGPWVSVLRSYGHLDNNVLVAHFLTDKTEEAKKKLVENALAIFAQLKDVQLCTSIWAIIEMVNILVSNKKMARGEVAEIEGQLVSERRLKNLKIFLLKSALRKTTISRSFPGTSDRVFSNIILEWET
jgi:predicted nucleic-acid-binding protein